MEKLLGKIIPNIQYKIAYKDVSKSPTYATIDDADSIFIYVKLNDNTPLFIAISDIASIIPNKYSRSDEHD